MATPSVTDERTLRADTLPRLIYKDSCEDVLLLFVTGTAD